ncbi:MAG: CatB-related O-acetyltransferase [Tissierellales bacterium]|nr:CatB-related O-acetyltransferase [Tissierellales bacterium]
MQRVIQKIKMFFLNKKIEREGGEAFSETIRKFYFSKYNIHIGYGSYGGCFNSDNIAKGTVFGNYCSIAQNVKIFRANHPLDYFTLHPLFYNPIFGYVRTDQLNRPVLTIGHDVWIGESTIILPSVKTIGNGAVIGAGSVVTKDVPPYSVVAGNPARIIKMRFSERQIKELEASRWWDWKKDELIKNKEAIESIINEK